MTISSWTKKKRDGSTIVFMAEGETNVSTWCFVFRILRSSKSYKRVGDIMICGGENCSTFVVTCFGHDWSRCFLATTNVLQFSPPQIIICPTLLYDFEELKILNTKHQVEAFCHLRHVNHCRIISFFLFSTSKRSEYLYSFHHLVDDENIPIMPSITKNIDGST